MIVGAKNKGIRKWSQVNGVMRIDVNPSEASEGLVIKCDIKINDKTEQYFVGFDKWETKKIKEFLK